MLKKKLLLVLNPISGQKKAVPFLPRILRVFSDNGYYPTVYVTNARGDATREVAACASDFDRIACIGGDGTLNEVISGVLASGVNIPIGYIPAGTTNDFASTLGLSDDFIQAATDCVTAPVRAIDIGSFNGRTFNYIASFGAFTRASYTTPQAIKNALGHFAYLLDGVSELSSLTPILITVTLPNGNRFSGEYLFGSISNSRSVAGLIKLQRDIVSLDDGQFEVMLISMPPDLIALTELLGAIQRGRPGESPLVQFFNASSLSVHCPGDLPWTLDGEDAGETTDAEIHVLPRAVSLAIPEA